MQFTHCSLWSKTIYEDGRKLVRNSAGLPDFFPVDVLVLSDDFFSDPPTVGTAPPRGEGARLCRRGDDSNGSRRRDQRNHVARRPKGKLNMKLSLMGIGSTAALVLACSGGSSGSGGFGSGSSGSGSSGGSSSGRKQQLRGERRERRQQRQLRGCVEQREWQLRERLEQREQRLRERLQRRQQQLLERRKWQLLGQQQRRQRWRRLRRLSPRPVRQDRWLGHREHHMGRLQRPDGQHPSDQRAVRQLLAGRRAQVRHALRDVQPGRLQLPIVPG